MLKLAGNELPVTAVLLRVTFHRFEQLVMTKDARQASLALFVMRQQTGEIGELFFATMLKKV
ncbi:Uncharacterised protein [Salmonella enterica subsp. enterica serovar Bovismorbificans]|uniref:Uncharacterized protein n=1 Tax=Salmonella enterica subsp. enterica serovar Bovismorbificans TaxID=58097 RepID=A0A655DGC4_SALET|nr:Uncharacterised protein [Salmonella enterica subsp. enterica serovar Bovismorbificans]